MKRKLENLIIPLISTKWTITSHLNSLYTQQNYDYMTRVIRSLYDLYTIFRLWDDTGYVVCCCQNPVLLSWLMTGFSTCVRRPTGTTNETGTPYPSGAAGFTPDFCGVRADFIFVVLWTFFFFSTLSLLIIIFFRLSSIYGFWLFSDLYFNFIFSKFTVIITAYYCFVTWEVI